MSTLKVLRGRDIEAKINNSPLFGLSELDVTDKPRFRYIYEYLSETPYDAIGQGNSYRIRLKLLSMFSEQIPMDRSFSLSLNDGEYLYIYEQCRVVERYTDVQGNESVKEVFQIEAQFMREQEIDDD